MDHDLTNSTNLFWIFPQTYGLDVPNACTIVIIAGKGNLPFLTNTFLTLGKDLNQVDSVLAQVDRLTQHLFQLPVAVFIFRNKESDEVHYSEENR